MTNYNLLSFFVIGLTLLSTPLAFSHAEHGKHRYVANDGDDKGHCESPSKPCKTIAYTTAKSNKGDKVLVASGAYEVNADNLFYLISGLIPITGGYSRNDSYALKKKINRTILRGVPVQFATQLSKQGFIAIVDQKGNKPESLKELNKQLGVYSKLLKSKPASDCINGMSGDHPCSNVDLLGNVSLSDMSASAGNDIWGHVDLNDNREYAIMGLINGIAVIEVTDPQNPRLVGKINSYQTDWRDIKVYQFRTSETARWQSYAYVSSETASSPETTALEIIDLNNLPNSVTKLDYAHPFSGSHNILISNINYSTGVTNDGQQAFLHMAGERDGPGSFVTFSLSNPTDPEMITSNTTKVRTDYSHDIAAMTIIDDRVAQCDNANTNNCEILMDFNEQEMRIWDKTNNSAPELMGQATYPNLAYTHSGWQTDDNMYVLVHDEGDEMRFGINTRVIIFKLSDLCSPEMVAEYSGPTRAIDHNGFVRGNKYYMSNYQRGMAVLDISNPEQPRDIGFFDTYPMADSAIFGGAWGVYPFLPSGNILVSDMNSGLYILKDNSVANDPGTVSTSTSASSCNQSATSTPTTTPTPTPPTPIITTPAVNEVTSSGGGGYISIWLIVLELLLWTIAIKSFRKKSIE